jgi:hypothetical protein
VNFKQESSKSAERSRAMHRASGPSAAGEISLPSTRFR